jgi:Na+/melibiose symporter-like transporter
VLAVAGLVTLVYALAGAPAPGWGPARTLALLALSAGLLGGFAAVERRARQPLVPSRTWRNRPLAAGVVVMFGATGILVGTFFLNTLYLQDVLGASPLRAGLEFLPLVAVIGLGAHLTSRLLPRAGSRALAVTGLILMAGGTLWLSFASARTGYVTGLLPGMLLAGAGTGLVFPAASVTAMSDIDPARAGLASGLMTSAHDIGAALGAAVFSVLATSQAGEFTAGYQHGFAVATGIAGGLALLAVLAAPAVRPPAGTRLAVH